MKQDQEIKKLGDILVGAKRGRDAALHFIVFLDGNDENTFIGAVLTHSNKYKNNILMDEGHFRKLDKEGKEYVFQYDNTHLVKGRFIKLQDWGPFEKIGALTEEGVKFVESATSTGNPMLWDEYIKMNETT